MDPYSPVHRMTSKGIPLSLQNETYGSSSRKVVNVFDTMTVVLPFRESAFLNDSRHCLCASESLDASNLYAPSCVK